jgi:hypothetical protein
LWFKKNSLWGSRLCQQASVGAHGLAP